MSLKKQTGNMYDFVTHMWSPIRGKCSHDCSYCYMKKWGPQKPLHIDEKDLETNLSEGNFIFVCHTCDLFAKDVPDIWIRQVLNRTRRYNNKYLFQSKNPKRMVDYIEIFPPDVLLGTTIETNRDIVKSNAPSVKDRAEWLGKLSAWQKGFDTMVTIEPIFDFDLSELVYLITTANPEWVNIGADSKGHNLPEPPLWKVKALIDTLKEKAQVKLKGNLKRIYKYNGREI